MKLARNYCGMQQRHMNIKGTFRKQAARCLAIGLLAGISLKLFAADILHISGSSMEPGIRDGSVVLVNKLAYGIVQPFGDRLLCSWAEPAAGDIVIYLYNNKIIIKRCAATGGTPLDYSADKGYTLLVNNASFPLSAEQYYTMCTIRSVPEGTILAIGDNAAVSVDSRTYGFIPVNNVLGKAVCR